MTNNLPENATDDQIFDYALWQLRRAFTVSFNDIRDRRRRDMLSGFDRGSAWGNDVLERYMPRWFEEWFKHENWVRAVLLGDLNEWFSAAEDYGYPIQKWCELLRIFVPCYLSYNNLTIEACEKPAVTKHFTRKCDLDVVPVAEFVKEFTRIG